MDIWSGHSDQTEDGLAKKKQILSAKTNDKKAAIISSQEGENASMLIQFSHPQLRSKKFDKKYFKKMFSASTLLRNTVC